ncbi:MAG TPA: TonB-dependent receptor [Woeseiaceae bacterium]|nr:TonB-dependent receptor [Woeseiaceae bacterium]
MNKHFLIFASAFTIALGFVAYSDVSLAQEGATDRVLDEIVVTSARRREELVQEVPISISIITGDELARVGAVDIIDIAKRSPNVTLEVSRGTNSTLSAFIRGVGQQDPVAGFESGVGLYLDDVYFNRPHAAVLDLYDVQRVEVLRGPQGTLYGRNTIGGAIRYVTRPLSDEPELKLKGAIGSYSQFDALVRGSIPLSDSFRIGATVARFTRDGYGENLNLGIDQYDKDVTGVRLSAEWDATDALNFVLHGDYTQDDSNPKSGYRLMVGAVSGAPILDNVFDTRAGLNVPEQDVESSGVSLTTRYDYNDSFTFKAILADRSDDTWSPIDFDALPVDDLDVPVNYTNDQTSAELQLLYSGEKLNGVFGYYYLDANAFNEFDVVLGQLGPLINIPGLNANTYGDVDTSTWSVYADYSWDFSEAWSVALGGRYTSDERDSRVLRRTFAGGISPVFGGSAVVIATTSDFNGSSTDTNFSPRASISWRPVENNHFYLSYSEGFKGGSFDPRGQTTAAPDLNNDGTVSDAEIYDYMHFDPETVKSYEFGWKTTALDNRLSSAITLFYGDYTDVQIPGSIGVDTNDDGIQDTFVGVTTNAGKARMPGVELEGAFQASDHWNFDWAIGYLDAEFTQFIGPSGDDISDQAVIQNTPKWTAATDATFETPLTLFGNGGTISFIGTVSYRGDSSQFEFPNALLDQESFTLYDMSIVWEDDGGRWRVGLHGKNLSDEEYKVAGYDFPALGLEGNVTAFYGPPRTVTGTVEYLF